VLIGAIVVVILIVVMIIRAVAGGSGSSSAKETPAAQVAVPSISQVAKAAAAPNCDAKNLQMTIDAADDTFADGAKPVFNITVTNNGKAACTLNQADIIVKIRSGSDAIYESDQCAAGASGAAAATTAAAQVSGAAAPASAAAGATAGTAMYTIQPNANQAITFTWNRERSNATCDSGLPAPKAGTYRAKALLGSLSSTETVFTLS
jgi:hypothetical protein